MSSLCTIVTPVIAAVSCGKSNSAFNFNKDLNKDNDQTSTKNLKTLTKDIKNKTKNTKVRSHTLGIENFNLTQGVTAEYTLAENLNDNGSIKVSVKLIYKNQSKSKNIIILPRANHDFTQDFNKLQNNISTKLLSDLKTIISNKNYGTILTAEKLGIDKPKLSEGTTLIYTLDENWNGSSPIKIKSTLNFNKTGEKVSKKITIFSKKPCDFTADLVKLQNAPPNKFLADLRTDITNKSDKALVSEAKLGFVPTSALSPGVMPIYNLHGPWNGINSTIKAKVILKSISMEKNQFLRLSQLQQNMTLAMI